MKEIKLNAATLHREINWLSEILYTRFDLYFGKETKYKTIFDIPVNDLTNDDSIFSKFIKHYNFSFAERLAIILALTPHLKPQVLDVFFSKNTKYERIFTEFGGIRGDNFGGFLPTGETLAFILAGYDFNIKFQIFQLFEATHTFFTHNILKLSEVKDNEPKLSGQLIISGNLIDLFTIGKSSKPSFSTRFPAKIVTTQLEWDDLIVENNILQEINDIIMWMKHQNKILNEWNLQKTIKPGYRALFHGPPGTGKTFAASLIGKYCKKDVYKIDLSMVISKWVGETEKNLAAVFDMAENKDWILFFDEADALFGKRTGTQTSQERYANQEVAYLLQRTEDYNGTVILASNLKANMDEAFTRRFQSIIYFPLPKFKERLKLWDNYLSKTLGVEEKIDLKKIATDYEISGGGIVNVLKYCSIHAAERNQKLIIEEDLLEGIKRELQKEGKLL